MKQPLLYPVSTERALELARQATRWQTHLSDNVSLTQHFDADGVNILDLVVNHDTFKVEFLGVEA